MSVARSVARLYWLGNIAKTRVIDEILTACREATPVTVFDYGCGDGGDWPSVLRDFPALRLIAYEPVAEVARRAAERLRGLDAEVLAGDSLSKLPVQVDYIVSFSVFEHVIARAEYLQNAKHLLSPHGIFYLNYDDGHFRNVLDLARPSTWMQAVRERLRTVASGPLAALGVTSVYQQRVTTGEAERLVTEAGFIIERSDYHNLLCFKELCKTVASDRQQDFTRWWLEVELALNERFRQDGPFVMSDGINLWQQMLSRTLVLRHCHPDS